MNQRMEKIAILQLRPNPFRELDDYAIDREKVDKLMARENRSSF